MNGNEFCITSSWEMRPESAELLGQKMLHSLEALSDISPYFGSWRFFDRRKPKGIPLAEARGRMAAIVEQGVMRDDFGKPEPWRGYFITASNNPNKGPRTVGLRIHGGVQSPRSSNDAIFETSYGKFPDPAIVAYPVFKQILLTLSQIWDVDYTRVYSSELSARWPGIRYIFEPSWMTYLSAPYASRIVVPKSILSEPVPGGGLLLIAAEETFDAANPTHMANAHAISDVLAPLDEVPASRLPNDFKLF